LAINEKFIDYAWLTFENVAPGCNDFFIFFDDNNQYIKKTPHRSVRRRHRLGFELSRRIAEYDFVVVHSLHPFWIPVINDCSDNVVFVWIGWGYDYYDLLYKDSNKLLQPLTRALKAQLRIEPISQLTPPSWSIRIQRSIETVRLNSSKGEAINSIQLFAPVLPEEYLLVRKAVERSKLCRRFPQQVSWNYGSLEEVWVKDFLGRSCSGRNILIGNSASYTCNHLDLLQWLGGQLPVIHGRTVYCTLSYGDSVYAEHVQRQGNTSLPGQFQALLDFLPLSDYTATVASCSHLLMNHVRQQGVGTLVIMLYLGATVVLREECPTYVYLKNIGFFVQSMQSLERTPSLLSQVLDPAQQRTQRELLARHWSKMAIDLKTIELIRAARKFTGSLAA
jgi:hypothetical protein